MSTTTSTKQTRVPRYLSERDSPEKDLWRSVLLQAFTDVCNGNQREKDSVVEWINSKDFISVCDLADVPKEQTAKAIRTVTAMPNRGERMLWLKRIREKFWIMNS